MIPQIEPSITFFYKPSSKSLYSDRTHPIAVNLAVSKTAYSIPNPAFEQFARIGGLRKLCEVVDPLVHDECRDRGIKRILA